MSTRLFAERAADRGSWPDWVGGPVSGQAFEADPREVAPYLLGKLLVSVRDGRATGGRIVETEAYLGSSDPGSHASTKGITRRNAVMYGPPGRAYVYFTYGSHHMLNIVCQPDGTAGAVLIRALEPLVGVETMSKRRGGKTGREIAGGPGRLAQSLEVDLDDNGTPLNQGRLFLYDAPCPDPAKIGVSGRIGLSAGHELELRYYLIDDPFVSSGRTGPPRRGVRRRTGGDRVDSSR